MSVHAGQKSLEMGHFDIKSTHVAVLASEEADATPGMMS